MMGKLEKRVFGLEERVTSLEQATLILGKSLRGLKEIMRQQQWPSKVRAPEQRQRQLRECAQALGRAKSPGSQETFYQVLLAIYNCGHAEGMLAQPIRFLKAQE